MRSVILKCMPESCSCKLSRSLFANANRSLVFRRACLLPSVSHPCRNKQTRSLMFNACSSWLLLTVIKVVFADCRSGKINTVSNRKNWKTVMTFKLYKFAFACHPQFFTHKPAHRQHLNIKKLVTPWNITTSQQMLWNHLPTETVILKDAIEPPCTGRK